MHNGSPRERRKMKQIFFFFFFFKKQGSKLPKVGDKTLIYTLKKLLGWEDPLEKEMATHSSILAWKIPWPEKAGRLQSMGSHRVGHD